jgi:Tol biopolymer transport system component
MIGKTLAHYDITDRIGAGGMGEVYRALDKKLGRHVALKFLPDVFARDPERLSRFEREAKLLASLNHAHIAAIYGIEEADSVRFLALELVEGEDLAQRIARGALAVNETLAITRQVAEALEVAHEQGVIHRDLKPANIKVTPDGNVKVLDFGLAKALDPDSGDSASDLSQSPTVLGSSPTMQGVILGTAAYMSPEQARGKSVDRRADIFAFGCVLFEMLTGRRCFSGETVSDTLASVLARDPDWNALPSATPNTIKKLLKRCLDKDPLRRLRDIGEARIMIEDVLAGKDEATAAAAPVQQIGSRRGLAWITGAVAVVAIALAALLGINYLRLVRQAPTVVRAFVPPPEGMAFALSALHPGAAVVSPDGSRLVFAARDADGAVLLYVRDLDEVDARPLPGTDGGGYPFWSPDSKHIGFVADGKLKRIDAAGGPPLTLCDAAVGKGGTWNREGVILFAPSFNTPIHRVSAAGGVSTAVTELRGAQGENSHRHPHFLPDGAHYLYFSRGSASPSGDTGNKVMLASLDGDSSRVLVHSRSHSIYAAAHILFIRESALMAQPFDPDKLEFTGDAFPVVEQVKYIPGAYRGVFSASNNGVLVYQTGEGDADNQLVWLDRDGEELSVLGDDATFADPRISPDGQSVVVEILDARSGSWDLWTYDVARKIRTRFTFDPTNDVEPQWSPDGETIVFGSGRSGSPDLYLKPFGGSATETELLVNERSKFPTSWSWDGEYVAYTELSDSTQSDIWVVSVDGDDEPFPFIQTQFADFNARFSPDGRWVAYASSESGRTEVYVRPFPGPGRKWQISSNGGSNPTWRSDGKELFYSATSEHIVAVELDYRDDTLIIGEETPLFDFRAGSDYEPTSTGTPSSRASTDLDGDRLGKPVRASPDGAIFFLE